MLGEVEAACKIAIQYDHNVEPLLYVEQQLKHKSYLNNTFTQLLKANPNQNIKNQKEKIEIRDVESEENLQQQIPKIEETIAIDTKVKDLILKKSVESEEDYQETDESKDDLQQQIAEIEETIAIDTKVKDLNLKKNVESKEDYQETDETEDDLQQQIVEIEETIDNNIKDPNLMIFVENVIKLRKQKLEDLKNSNSTLCTIDDSATSILGEFSSNLPVLFTSNMAEDGKTISYEPEVSEIVTEVKSMV